MQRSRRVPGPIAPVLDQNLRRRQSDITEIKSETKRLSGPITRGRQIVQPDLLGSDGDHPRTDFQKTANFAQWTTEPVSAAQVGLNGNKPGVVSGRRVAQPGPLAPVKTPTLWPQRLVDHLYPPC